MNIQALIQAKDVAQLKELLTAGKIVKVGTKLMTREEHENYSEDLSTANYYDLLQGVRKVLLKLRLSVGMLIENLVNSVKVHLWKILSQAA